MCYSSMIRKAFHAYVRETGAEMEIEQFREIYGWSLMDSSIHLPRAVDRWFDEMDGEDAIAIRAVIQKRNTAMVEKLTADIFKQRRRLTDAERVLKEKPTKKAAEDQRIATDKIERAVRRLPLYQGTAPTALDARIFPMHFAPIVIEDEGRRVIRLARYHCRQAGQLASVDRKYPGLYNARRDNLTPYWRNEFGHHHAVMLANSFWENVNRDGKNQVLHFTPEPRQLMHVACIYSVWEDPAGGPSLLSFAAVTDEPSPEIAAAGHDRCIVNLKEASISAWLKPEGRKVDELQGLLDDKQRPFYEHEVLAA
jgi:putative SOS response-associated peptidase YedK